MRCQRGRPFKREAPPPQPPPQHLPPRLAAALLLDLRVGLGHRLLVWGAGAGAGVGRAARVFPLRLGRRVGGGGAHADAQATESAAGARGNSAEHAVEALLVIGGGVGAGLRQKKRLSLQAFRL